MGGLLGVLRDPGEEPVLAPRPGIAELTVLAESVRMAGLPVRLTVEGDHPALPTALEVSSCRRWLQEGLTNVLEHAGPARAEVAWCCAADAVTIEVSDDGGRGPGSLELS